MTVVHLALGVFVLVAAVLAALVVHEGRRLAGKLQELERELGVGPESSAP